MNFESLPNEIILNLFEYLSFIHSFQCFFNLNSRLNKLLCREFNKLYVDFRRISKTKFNHVCENYIRPVIDQIISLHLSSDDDTPQQIELFFSHHNYQLRRFTHLQSISLSHIRSEQILDQIMIECHYLPSLTHFTIIHGHIKMSESDTKRLFHHIWNLPKLNYCHLEISHLQVDCFPNSPFISTSLRHLIIEDGRCSLSTFDRLYQYTPNLEYVSIDSIDNSAALEFQVEVNISIPMLSITRLKLIYRLYENTVLKLFENMPNLCYLSLYSYSSYMNGNELEELIKKHLPKLKHFHFLMEFEHDIDMNEILDTFRTPFWIDEHQWFV